MRWHVEEAAPSALADRPAIMQALSSLAEGSKTLCAARPEVLGEAPWGRLVVEHLAGYVGGRVVYASAGAETLDTRLEVGLALAAYGSMLLRLRAMTAAELKQPRGALWGRCPWGYRFSPDGMRLEPYEPEQNLVAVVRHMRLRGLKLRQIVEELKRLGFVGRTGRPLGITRIYELLDDGEGSRRQALVKVSAADGDEQPPESGFVERRPTAAGRPRHSGLSTK